MSLEDQFFLKEDRELINRLKILQEMKVNKETLAKVSGIKNDTVLNKLVELDIKAETLASLSIIPLIEIAWVDGVVDAKEKEVIIRSLGILSDSLIDLIDFDIVKCWLEHRPSQELKDSWIHYIQGLREIMDADTFGKFKNEIMNHATAVAEASGGYFNMGTVSKKEKELLKELDYSFN
jgi:hypothetical protein